MSIGTVLTLTGLFLSFVGSTIAIAVVWGRFTEKVAVLEKRMDEIKADNQKQHDDFYETRRAADKLATVMDQVLETLSELKIGIKDVQSRLPAHRA